MANRNQERAWRKLALGVVPSLVAIGLAGVGVWNGRPWSTVAGAFVAFAGAFLNLIGILQPFFVFASAGFLLSARWLAPQHRPTRIGALVLGVVAFALVVWILSVDAPYCESCYWWPWKPWREFVV